MFIDLIERTVPERPLDPPEGRAIGSHDWLASFTCHIGDEGLLVHITAEVTRADELDPESIQAVVKHTFREHEGRERTVEVDISDALNAEQRKQIAAHFESNFSEIYGACND